VDGPGVAAADKGGEAVARRSVGGALGGGDLVAGLVVVGGAVDLAEDADGGLVEVAAVGEPGDRERGGGVGVVRVVDEDCVGADVGDLGDPDAAGSGVADQSPQPGTSGPPGRR
jgi:hypothetical protein